jgi:hypothetical protein
MTQIPVTSVTPGQVIFVPHLSTQLRIVVKTVKVTKDKQCINVNGRRLIDIRSTVTVQA